MKVLHITAKNKGGAGIAALRLHNALTQNGIESGFLCANETINFNNQTVNDLFFNYKKLTITQRVIKKIEKIFKLSKRINCITEIEKVKSKLEYEITSLPFSNYKLHEHPLVKEADIINFHWMGEILDYKSFFQNCNKPIVWTLHDMNPFLGIFHYKNDMLSNASVIGKLDIEVQNNKKAILKTSSLAAIITPSKWMLDEVFAQNFMHNIQRICIPNAIDFSIFEKLDTATIRKEYNINTNEFVLLFVADSIQNKRKGFDLLSEALLQLEHLPITLVTVGKGELPNFKFKNVSLGAVSSALTMACCYAMSDVFILPSKEDNLPNVMLEAFAAGTPVVSFANGGMIEHVLDGETGYLAKNISAKSLAEAIEKVYLNKEIFSKKKIKKYAYEKFNLNRQAKLYNNLYQNIIDKQK